MDTPKIADTKPVGIELEEGKAYFFCSCGHSSSQPFCDGSHKGTGFAPLKFVAEESKKKFLCQCKQSKNFPYCDGSHKGL